MTPSPLPADAGTARFANALKELHRIARINAVGVSTCLEHYCDHPDDDQAVEMIASSFGFALGQVAHLHRELMLLRLESEVVRIHQQV